MLLSQIRKLHSHTPSSSSYVCVYAKTLRECVETSNLSKVRTIHANVIKMEGIESDYVFIHNHLVNAYVKCGDIKNGLQVFDEMPVKNVVSWTVLIAGLVQRGFPKEAASTFLDMHRMRSVRPNEYTFVSALQACSFAESLDIICVLQVYALIIKFGFGNNTYLVNAFLTALIRHGMLGAALRVFQGCIDKDIVSWNAMFDGFLKFACQDIPQFCYRMIWEGTTKPDEFTFATVLSGLAELSELELGLQVHALLVKCGHGAERCVGNALVDMYSKNEKLGDGFMAFEEIPMKDVRSWSQMAARCLNCGAPIEALRVIGEMRAAGVQVNEFTLATGINTCANLVSLEEGQKIQGLMVKIGGGIDVCVENALLDLYAKCGSMDGALRVFGSMSERSVVSWTTMIMGYAQNGQPEEALKIFEQMKLEATAAAARPNGVTWMSVLYACSQGGYVEAGLEYFSSMRQEHGISPGEEHYACVVDLLGKAGRINEAEQVILEMPFRPSVVIWKTLLGACRLHGDLETARHAAKHAFAIDEKDPSTYVLLQNTFADLGNWQSAEMLRTWRQHKKIPGSSWLPN